MDCGQKLRDFSLFLGQDLLELQQVFRDACIAHPGQRDHVSIQQVKSYFCSRGRLFRTCLEFTKVLIILHFVHRVDEIFEAGQRGRCVPVFPLRLRLAMQPRQVTVRGIPQIVAIQ